MKASDIKKIACIGAGIIGSSWVTIFVKNGLDVNVYDPQKESLDVIKDKVRANLRIFQDNGFMSAAQVDEAIGHVYPCYSLEEAVEGVQFIQESSPERLEIKQDLLARIDKLNTTALIASSTSGINLSQISAKSEYANRCVVGHPFNPPHIMPLVEITQWEKTDKAYVQLAYDFYKGINKEPVILNKETPGFIGNRLQAAYVKEAIQLVSDGICSVEAVDKASIYGLGIRWAILGPYMNGELNGGENGIRDYMGEKYKAGFDGLFKMILSSKIDEIPIGYADEVASPGVEEERANRPAEQGKTNEEIAAYRDKLLLGILNLHGKL